MGLDINLFVEIKDDYGKWQPSALVCNLTDDNRVEFKTVEVGCSRNYVLFGILSNTKNIFGMPYISNPRGEPIDVNPITKKTLSRYYDYYAGQEDVNYMSWVTLKEIEDYIEKYGEIMSIEGYVLKSVKNNSLVNYTHRSGVRDLTNWSCGKKFFAYNVANKDAYYKDVWQSRVVKILFDDIHEALQWWTFKNFDANRIRLVFWYEA
jgi:hypothetical protein